MQEVGVPEQPVQVEAAGVRGQLGVEPGAQPAKGMGMGGGEAELLG